MALVARLAGGLRSRLRSGRSWAISSRALPGASSPGRQQVVAICNDIWHIGCRSNGMSTTILAAALAPSPGGPKPARRARGFSALPAQRAGEPDLERSGADLCDRFGLTIPAWRVIATLGQYGVRTARDIAAHGVMHKSTVSRAVSLLERRGLVAAQAQSGRPARGAARAHRRRAPASTRRSRPQALAFEGELSRGARSGAAAVPRARSTSSTTRARGLAPDGEESA